MSRFRQAALAVASATALALMSSTASPLPISVVCPPALNPIGGSDTAESLEGTAAADCLVGNDGGDRLLGGKGDDLIDPGPGIDKATGQGGNDTFVVRAACEVGRGEVISGGGGVDTVRSPFTQSQLEGLGVRLRSIENVEVVPSEFAGGCVRTATSVECTCCDHEGFDPSAACAVCLPGLRLDDPVERTGDHVSTGYEAPRCVADPTCAATDCGAHGTCSQTATGATCICAAGYAGPHCEDCAPLYDRTAAGLCMLGPTCAREKCGNHGVCAVGGRIDALHCNCDSGWEGSDCRGEDTIIGGPGFVSVDEPPQIFGLKLRNGAHCTTKFKWKRTAGRGRVRVNHDDSHLATYKPPRRLRGLVEHARIEAVCANNPAIRAHRDIVVGTRIDGSDADRVSGECDELVAAAVDSAMLSYLNDNELEGATLAISYQEQVVCTRGYGSRGRRRIGVFEFIDGMPTCTPMRVASVTKPFTRALYRGNLFGQAIPAALGGGTVGESTPLLPILAPTMGLGPGNALTWQAPASLYNGSYPPFIVPSLNLEPCSSSDGVINSAWPNITVQNTLGHTAGFPPNQQYAFSPTTGSCTGQMGEVCGSLANVGDPTVSNGTVIDVPNDLGLDHGVITIDDMVQWIAGICPYDSPNAGRFRYSNIGFTIAGKAIENLTGQSYEDYLVDVMSGDGIVDLDAPGSPVVYLGQSKGGGPRTYSLASWMQEADYFTPRGASIDVTFAFPLVIPFPPSTVWIFPNVAPAPYGATNYDIMGPHGGLVMNTMALMKFGSEYLIKDGTPRDAARGGPGLNVYPDDPNIIHNGLLYGTVAWAWEIPVTQPSNSNNANGAGCLVPGDKNDSDDPVNNNGLNVLDVEPCPLPSGIRVAAIFNDEPPLQGSGSFVRGRHDLGLFTHVIRRALSDVGTTAAEWSTVQPLSDLGLRIGCDLKCPPMAECVHIDCGNGIIDHPWEECDDGDNDFGDDCLPDCTIIDEEPPGYEDCAGEDPGTCLGGPCAPRETEFVSQTELRDPYSVAHPDGDFSRNSFCHDAHTAGLDWEEATCVRVEILDEDWGVCMQCGVDTMTGCACPAPNDEDGGCNQGEFNGYSCVGGRCWQGLPPSWMCTADCANDIYGESGYCFHDDAKGAVCYSDLCDEPVPTWCAVTFGTICDPNVEGCVDDVCCEPECFDDDDCTTLGYSPGHTCVQERCKL